MKLRLHGDSLRLRLSRAEVDRLRDNGRIEEAIHFPGGTALLWTLESCATVAAPEAHYGDTGIRVLVPAAQARAWAASNEVGIYSPAGSSSPALIIEKDFQCLHEPASPDAFPNPTAGHNAQNPASS